MSEFVFDNVKNPEFFKENVWKAHSAHSYYANERELMDVSSLVLCMDGVWNFDYAKNYDLAIKGFEKLDYDCHGWDTIKVPAHIQMEGYDAPQYANVNYPWDGREDIIPGEIPTHFNPVASYVKYFYVPANMKDKEIHIRFDGVESGFALWLNGTYIGYSEDSFTQSEFDITPFLCEGENKLAVQVFKWTASSWCEDQDFFRFSGIYRSVYLVAIPKVHIEDYFVKTLFNGDDFTKADLQVEFKVRGTGKITGKLLYQKNEVANFSESVSKENSVANSTGTINNPVEASEFTVKVAVDKPVLWSAEQPYLYELLLTAYDEAGQVVEVVKQNVGFRKFEMKNNRMLINGKRVVFKGVNRHEFSSICGRVPVEEELIKDLQTMKRNNINAIRTCHYPDNERIYELCDEYGFYLIAENNLETHGTWDGYWRGKRNIDFVVPNDKKEFKEMMYDRIRSTFNRDKNHPCIVLWSCGNEAFGGETIFEMSELFRKLDDTRLVHYEGVFNDRRYNDTSDMESRMYPKVWDIEAYLEDKNAKPFICCEYTHAMGNSCGGMHKYTELADRPNSGYQGGFIWDYVDQSIYKKTRYGQWYQAYGGDFGDRPCDFNFSGNGIVYGGERDESPKMQEVKYNYQNIQVTINKNDFEVWNKHLFTNTSDYNCEAILLRDGKEFARKVLSDISVEPESKKTFPMPFEVPEFAGEYVLTISFTLKEDRVYAKRGHEVAFGQAVIGKVEKVVETPKGRLVVSKGTHNTGVRGELFEVLFSDLNGGMTSYRMYNKEMICKMPRPNFWRCPTDNDEGNNMTGVSGQWKLASLYHTTAGQGKKIGDHVFNPVVEEKADSVLVTYYYQLQTTPNAKCEVAYEVFPDGTVKITLSYDPESIERLSGVDGPKLLGDMPEFGMIMKIDADYDHIEWYGNGPRETYADRKHGAKLGVYKGLVGEQMAKYLNPQESGNKTDVRYAKVTDMKGRGFIFTGEGMNFSALPYTPHEIENARHDHELPQVHYTVIRCALEQMGIGGDDSWGAPVHEEYHIKSDVKKEFTFTMKGI